MVTMTWLINRENFFGAFAGFLIPYGILWIATLMLKKKILSTDNIDMRTKRGYEILSTAFKWFPVIYICILIMLIWGW